MWLSRQYKKLEMSFHSKEKVSQGDKRRVEPACMEFFRNKIIEK